MLLHALGGELLGEGSVPPVRRSLIALAGVAGQAALLVLALLAQLPADLHEAFLRRNAVLLLLNLVPIRPLDGALAWKLPRRLRAAGRLSFGGEVRPPQEVRKDVADLLRKIRGSSKVN